MRRSSPDSRPPGRRPLTSRVGLLLIPIVCPAILWAASGRVGQPGAFVVMSASAWVALGFSGTGCLVHGSRWPIGVTMLGLLVVATGVPGSDLVRIVVGVVIVAVGLVLNTRAAIPRARPVEPTARRRNRSRAGRSSPTGSAPGR